MAEFPGIDLARDHPTQKVIENENENEDLEGNDETAAQKNYYLEELPKQNKNEIQTIELVLEENPDDVESIAA